MDVLLFALFSFLAFFLLIIGTTRKDKPTMVFSIVLFLITSFMLFSTDLTFVKITNGFSQLTASNCVNTASTLNCTYSAASVNATQSNVSLLNDTSLQSGLGLLYFIFAFYLIVLMAVSLRG